MQRALEAGERLGHARETLRGDPPVVFGVVRHEVEARTDVLHRAADDAQRAQLLARVVQLHREAEPLGHHVGRDAVAVIRPVRALECRQRVAVKFVALVTRLG